MAQCFCYSKWSTSERGAGRQEKCWQFSKPFWELLYCRLVLVLWIIRPAVGMQRTSSSLHPSVHRNVITENKCTDVQKYIYLKQFQNDSFFNRRNIEIKMKQNITDDACIVDFCALKNITMRMPSEISQKQECLSFFQSGFPPQIWFLQYNVAFKIWDETAISSDQSRDWMNNEEMTQCVGSLLYWWQFQYVCAGIKQKKTKLAKTLFVAILYYLYRLLTQQQLLQSIAAWLWTSQ